MKPGLYVSSVDGRATHYTARAVIDAQATDEAAQVTLRECAQALDLAMKERRDSPSEAVTAYSLQINKLGDRAIYAAVLGQPPVGGER